MDFNFFMLVVVVVVVVSSAVVVAAVVAAVVVAAGALFEHAESAIKAAIVMISVFFMPVWLRFVKNCFLREYFSLSGAPLLRRQSAL